MVISQFWFLQKCFKIPQILGTTVEWGYSISRFIFKFISSGCSVQNSNSLTILTKIYIFNILDKFVLNIFKFSFLKTNHLLKY